MSRCPVWGSRFEGYGVAGRGGASISFAVAASFTSRMTTFLAWQGAVLCGPHTAPTLEDTSSANAFWAASSKSAAVVRRLLKVSVTVSWASSVEVSSAP